MKKKIPPLTQIGAVFLLGTQLRDRFYIDPSVWLHIDFAMALVKSSRALDAGKDIIAAASKLFTLCEENQYIVYQHISSDEYKYVFHRHYPVQGNIHDYVQELFNTLYINHIALTNSLQLADPIIDQQLQQFVKEYSI